MEHQEFSKAEELFFSRGEKMDEQNIRRHEAKKTKKQREQEAQDKADQLKRIEEASKPIDVKAFVGLHPRDYRRVDFYLLDKEPQTSAELEAQILATLYQYDNDYFAPPSIDMRLGGIMSVINSHSELSSPLIEKLRKACSLSMPGNIQAGIREALDDVDYDSLFK